MSKDKAVTGLLEIDKAFLERAAELLSAKGTTRSLTKPCPGPDTKTSRPCDCGRPHVREFIFSSHKHWRKINGITADSKREPYRYGD